MSNPASEEAIAEVHVAIAAVLKERLANKELCTAADINAAIKFCKDNNVTCKPSKTNHMGKLQEQLRETTANAEAMGADSADLEAALASIEFHGAAN